MTDKITANGVCIYSGSSIGTKDVYREVAESIGVALSSRDITVVYGGGDLGLMGVVARSALKNNGKVTGIIPRAMVGVGEKGRGEKSTESDIDTFPNLDTVVVESMHERKLAMAERSRAFIALPGGFGTLEELLEVTTWSQLNIHSKPVVAINVDGFYEPLKAFITTAVEAGFISKKNADLLKFIDTPVDGDWGKVIFDAFEQYRPTGEEYNFNWAQA
ncbi:hypothetical protein E3Q23_00356 [Wallemia mellicola]|uniref:Cytokinin riboside 5'-monophosphate phosphoribohydrolase n=1 Tax=Wallemia mellicola TaxID=1708541 RepID=A0A4T0TUN1_9BASI|nr:hypothetical protein E3Q23_00356 [Wallemia mellicola]TIC34160.1 hypothetical protein E3Q10_00365 [Wallemia mellicola]TIC68956.1 hypothetical protein E3Q01_00647 [Wallemia mellicola]